MEHINCNVLLHESIISGIKLLVSFPQNILFLYRHLQWPNSREIIARHLFCTFAFNFFLCRFSDLFSSFFLIINYSNIFWIWLKIFVQRNQCITHGMSSDLIDKRLACFFSRFRLLFMTIIVVQLIIISLFFTVIANLLYARK